MARGKRNQKQKKRPVRAKRRRGSRPRRSNASGLGSLVVRGVRNLIGAIPGASAFKAIADYAFRAIGYGECVVKDGLVTVRDTQYGALSTRFCLNYVNVLMGSREAIRFPAKNDATDKYRYTLFTPWLEARLVSLTVSIKPSNPVAKRSGVWSIGFKPFFDATDHAAEMGRHDEAGRVGIMGYPFFRTAPASQSLSLTYVPRVVDGHAYQFHPLATTFGCICVRYDNYSRDSPTADFTPEQFALELIITGTLEMRGRLSDDNNSVTYIDKFDNPAPKVERYIHDTKTGKVFAAPSGSGSTVSNVGGSTVLKFTPINYSLALTDMEI